MGDNQLAAPQHSHEQLSSPIEALQDQLKFYGVVIIMSRCDSDIDVLDYTSRPNTVDKKNWHCYEHWTTTSQLWL